MQLPANTVHGALSSAAQTAVANVSPTVQLFTSFFAAKPRVLAPGLQRTNGNPTLEQQVFQDCPHP